MRVELSDEFDRNFVRKAFFDRPWKARRQSGRGSLLTTTARLKRSLRCRIQNTSLEWSSDAPYAQIHNEGGTIPITAKMRRYFWFRHIQATGKLIFNRKTRELAAGARNNSMSEEALRWRNMALSKNGKITIPQRQFIGDHPKVAQSIDAVVEDNLNRFINKNFKL